MGALVLTPRPYQSRIVEDLWSWWGRNPNGNPIIEACVGSGKSMMVAMIAQRAISEYPSTRILVIVPSKELLQQNVEELHRVWPRADVGVYSASVNKKQLGRAVTYATIGSVFRKAHIMGRVDLILIDECHLVSTKDAGMYRQLINDLRSFGSIARAVGLTGTPFRGNGIWLTAGEEALFSGIASSVRIRELLDLGFLAPLRSAGASKLIESSSVRMSGDDFVVSELAKVSDRDDIVQSACDEIVKVARDRKKWLVYCVTIEHADNVCDALLRRGVSAAVIVGDTPSAVRESRIAAFRSGTLQCLVSVAVLTTGFNVREVDFLALLRATNSPVLYTQILGRALRTAEGKTDALIADFTDTTERMGPVDSITGRLPSSRKGGEGPIKYCESCGSVNPAGATHCSSCGAPFPEPERIRHGVSASAAEVLSGTPEPKIETIRVADVQYRIHRKPESPDSLRVEYLEDGGFTPVAKEWVCLSHEGYARMKAERWWRQRVADDVPVPSSTEEAIQWIDWARQNQQPLLRAPASIVINAASKYPEILQYQWE